MTFKNLTHVFNNKDARDTVAIDTVTASAIAEKDALNNNLEKDFADQNKVVDDFKKDNHQTERELGKNTMMKKLHLSESLFEDDTTVTEIDFKSFLGRDDNGAHYPVRFAKWIVEGGYAPDGDDYIDVARKAEKAGYKVFRTTMGWEGDDDFVISLFKDKANTLKYLNMDLDDEYKTKPEDLKEDITNRKEFLEVHQEVHRAVAAAIDNVLDNIGMELDAKIPNYSVDWANDDGNNASAKAVYRAAAGLIGQVTDDLFYYKRITDFDESLKEAYTDSADDKLEIINRYLDIEIPDICRDLLDNGIHDIGDRTYLYTPVINKLRKCYDLLESISTDVTLKSKHANEDVDLSKIEGSMSNILQKHSDELNTATSKMDLITKVQKIFKDANIDTNASRRLIKNMLSKRDLTGAQFVLYNSILAGSNNRTIKESASRSIVVSADAFDKSLIGKIATLKADVIYGPVKDVVEDIIETGLCDNRTEAISSLEDDGFIIENDLVIIPAGSKIKFATDKAPSGFPEFEFNDWSIPVVDNIDIRLTESRIHEDAKADENYDMWRFVYDLVTRSDHNHMPKDPLGRTHKHFDYRSKDDDLSNISPVSVDDATGDIVLTGDIDDFNDIRTICDKYKFKYTEKDITIKGNTKHQMAIQPPADPVTGNWLNVEDYFNSIGMNLEDVVDDKTITKAIRKYKPVNESLTVIDDDFDIHDFEPWSGAVSTYNKIDEADKLDDLESVLENMFPDGCTRTQINDVLWFDDEWILETLGIAESEEEE